jgi:hypothetical protein
MARPLFFSAGYKQHCYWSCEIPGAVQANIKSGGKVAR